MWWNGGIVEWWRGGVVEWWSGGMVEWWSGGVVEWWSGGVVERGGWERNLDSDGKRLVSLDQFSVRSVVEVGLHVI